MRLTTLLASVGAVAFIACGGSVDRTGDDSPGPSSPAPAPPAAMAFFTPDDHFCARAASDNSADLKPQDSSEDIAVVSLSVAEECTNLGGQYLLASDVHSPKKYWLGGHGCRESKFIVADTFGVLRYTATSSVLTIPSGVCVSFPGDDNSKPTTTPTKVRAIAIFATQAQAEAYAKTIGR